MEVHKVTLLVIDLDRLGAEAVRSEIESVSYPNDGVSPHVIDLKTADCGEWGDDHPLNQSETREAEIRRLFPTDTAPQTATAYVPTGGAQPVDAVIAAIQGRTMPLTVPELIRTIGSLRYERDAEKTRADAAEALVKETREKWAEDSRCHLAMSAVFSADLDAAQQMVVECHTVMRALVSDVDINGAGVAVGDHVDAARESLALSAPIAGRWCLASERDSFAMQVAGLEKLAANREMDRDAATARAEKAEAAVRELVDTVSSKHKELIEEEERAEKAEAESAFDRQWAMKLAKSVTAAESAKNAAERRESELGIQVEAQKARLRLATECIDALSMTVIEWAGPNKVKPAKAEVKLMRAAWDAVLDAKGPSKHSVPAFTEEQLALAVIKGLRDSTDPLEAYARGWQDAKTESEK